MNPSIAFFRHVDPSRDSIIEIPAGADIDLQSIDTGVLFVFAEWSGQAIQSFRTLIGSVRSCSRKAPITIFLANTDEKPVELFLRNQGMIPHGGGEALWISEGQIIGRLQTCTEKDSNTMRELNEQLRAQR